jgi:NhaP-type Na+/H+ or K+/H+ antiporter
VAVDVVWAVAGGLVIGGLLGIVIGRLVLYLRREHKEAVGLDDFLALGLIALSYGAALLAHAYGFLAVFAAGLALRATERQFTAEATPEEATSAAATDVQDIEVQDPEAQEAVEAATHPEKAPAVMAQAVLAFNEQLERIGEVGAVVLLGGMLTLGMVPREAVWFVPLLFFVIRPIAVWLGLLGARVSRVQRRLIAWFGVRGIGSIYYLTYAIAHGVPQELAQRLTALTLTTVAVSIVVHGISVTPLMELYSRRYHRQAAPDEA